MVTRLFSILSIALCILFLAACDGSSPQPTPPSTPAATPVATPTGEGGIVDPSLGATVTPVPSPVGMSEADRVAVYSQVIAWMLERDLGTRFIYISPYLGQGDFLDNPDTDTPVPAALMESLEPAHHDRTFEIRDFADAIRPLEEGGRVKNEGIFITLGPILTVGIDSLNVRASYYRGVGDARGDIYTFFATGPGAWSLRDVKEEWNYRSVQETEEPTP